MKILFAYDGSECADAAIKDLQFAGLPSVSNVSVLSAVDVFIPPKADLKDREDSFVNEVSHDIKLAWQRNQEAFEKAEILAADAGKKLLKAFPEWKIETEAQADTPHWAIIAKAEVWKPDLIVVGSHGRSALGRTILGSVSQKVLYETQCSIRIARRRDKSKSESVRLILATDGSPDANAMIDEVASRVWKKGTEVKLVTAIETFSQYVTEPAFQMNRVRDIQNIAINKLTSAGLVVFPIITEEDPKHFLVRQAAEWEADCIFLGAKGHRFLERLLVGSVSSSVAARASCSVEVVRRKY